jgi:hypothetical protein
MRTTSRATRLLLGIALWLLATAAIAAPRIGVMTMLPGEIFFERFGHNAVVVDDPARGEPISYNFGYFDLDEPGFIGRFVHGDMRYMLVALPLRQDLAYYDEVGRGVSVHWLDLTPPQARSIADALAQNAKPENARYRYDYFTDNCSTRVRDVLDRALGGALQRQLAGRSQGNTYRSEAVRLASPATWMWLGFDIGLGPASDVPLSRWQEAFVPMRLAASLDEARGTGGRPLVASEQQLLTHRLAPEPAEGPRSWWPWLVAGLAFAAGVLALAQRKPRTLAAVAIALWCVLGLLGALLAFLWVGTDHRFAWANANLLLFDPLCLLLIPGGWAIAGGRKASQRFRIALALVAIAAVVTLPLQLLPQPQAQAPWIAFLLPLHLALFAALRRR